ncbi:sialin-like [Antedon mediterranea]|uniref:sialin-like n=1 Tax=Antedon mediterranea TaxID=105859 RepID=UPI003AF6D4C5
MKQTEKQIEKQPILQRKDTPPKPKIRYVITLLCFVGNVLIYAMRVNWSVAIIAMVAHPQNHTNSTVVDRDVEVFHWNMAKQQAILGSFYYGYTVTPFIGGWLVGRFGGYLVFMTGILLSSIATLATPSVAKIGVGFLIFNRTIDGIGQGFTIPALLVMIKNLSEVNERTTMLVIACSGSSVGPIISSYVSVLLCSSNSFLGGGWPSTFYLYGFGLSSVLIIALGYIQNSQTLSVILMVSAFGLYGFKFSGINSNVMDIAPLHSGIVIGIMISLGSCAGFIAPIFLGILTRTNNTLFEWRVVFWTVAGLQLLGLLVCLIFGTDKPQEWAEPDPIEIEMKE